MHNPTNRPSGLSPLGRFARFAAPLLAAVGIITPQVKAAPLLLDFTSADATDVGTVGWTRVQPANATAGITNIAGSGYNFQFTGIGAWNGGVGTQKLTGSGFHTNGSFAGRTFTLSNLPPNKPVKLYACSAWNGTGAGGYILFGDTPSTGVKAVTIGDPGSTGTIANLTYIGTATADGTGLVSGGLYGRLGVTAVVDGVNNAEGQTGGFIFLPTQTITATAGANGSISPVGVLDIFAGSSQTYTITANSGYHVADVLVNGASVGAVTSYTFNNISADSTISATFAPDGASYTINASAGANGSISPAGAVSAFQGTSKVFNITPATGYHIANVLVDGASVGAVTSYSFTNITANHTIAASFAIDTFAITASTEGNGTISPVGSTSVNYGGSQTYTVTPNAGYYISHVLVDGVSVGAVNSYTFENVTAAHTISVAFDNRTRLYLDFVSSNFPALGAAGWTPVIVTSEADTMVNISNINEAGYGFTLDHVGAWDNGNAAQPLTRSGAYTIGALPHPFKLTGLIPGQTVSLYASAGWDGNANGAYMVYGSSGSAGVKAQTIGSPGLTPAITNLTLIGTATADGTGKVTGMMQGMNANFTGQGQLGGLIFAIDAPPAFTITASAGANGSISPSGTVSVNGGANQAFTITPNSGFHVSDVLVDGVSVGAMTSYAFNTVVANHTISASFAANTVAYTINASAGANGTISPNGAVNAFQGTNHVFTITPNAGYHVADVLVDGVSAGPVGTYTFTNVQANHTIAASFAINTFTITASATGSGAISPFGTVSVNEGASQTFTFTPQSGYHVDEVVVDGVSVGATSTYTFENVTAAHTISVRFDNRTNLRLDFTSPNGTDAGTAQWTKLILNFLANTPLLSSQDINGTAYDFDAANVATWDNGDATQPLTRSGLYNYGTTTNDHTFNLSGLNPGQSVTMYACAAWNGNASGAYINFGDNGGVKAQTLGDPGMTPTFDNMTMIGTAIADSSGKVTGSFDGPNGVGLGGEGQVGGVIFAISAGGTPPTPYSTWISSFGLTGNDALPLADADKDGIANMLEYALGGTSPIDSLGRGLTDSRLATVGGTPSVMTLTIAVRENASFAADGNRMKAVVDGLTYTVEAANTLVDWGAPVVTEVTGTDAANIQAPLNIPDSGWTYRTFRTDGGAGSDPRDFIRVSVSQ